MIVAASTKTLLGPGGSWTTQWIPTQGLANLSEQFAAIVGVSAYSDQAGTVQIYQSDDPNNPQMTVPSSDVVSINPLQLATLQVFITHAFWQVVLTNGATQQTIFEAVVTQSQCIEIAILQEIKKLRFDLNSATLLKSGADNQPAGTF